MRYHEEPTHRSPLPLLFFVASLVGFATVSLMVERERAVLEPIARTAGPERQGLVQPIESIEPRRSDNPSAPMLPPHPVLPEHLTDIADDLLASPMLHHPPFAAEVDRWVALWSENFSKWMPAYLERMTSFETMVDSVVSERGLPWSLRYLPVIESGYSPTAVSSASAVGMWQFMAPTARDLGVEVSPLVDDRRDPFVSTDAAARYLAQLHGDFDSWFLALAAYNAGPERINGLLERYLPEVERSDAVYWALRDVLPKETADFVPNFLAAVLVASDPGAYGYDPPLGRPFEFEEVPVLGSVSFETIARAAGSTRAEIERLNPEYLGGRTPPERTVNLRLPPGTASDFRAYFDAPDGQP